MLNGPVYPTGYNGYSICNKIFLTNLESIRQEEFSVISEQFDVRKDVIPSSTVDTNNVIFQCMGYLFHLKTLFTKSLSLFNPTWNVAKTCSIKTVHLIVPLGNCNCSSVYLKTSAQS